MTGEGTPARAGPHGSTARPASQAGPAGHPVLQTLTAAECYDLLSPGGVGRVAFTTADGPVVLPVNYAMAGQTVIFRTAPDTLLAGYLDGPAGFEVDRLDEALSQGWSVLVTGRDRPDNPRAACPGRSGRSPSAPPRRSSPATRRARRWW